MATTKRSSAVIRLAALIVLVVVIVETACAVECGGGGGQTITAPQCSSAGAERTPSLSKAAMLASTLGNRRMAACTCEANADAITLLRTQLFENRSSVSTVDSDFPNGVVEELVSIT